MALEPVYAGVGSGFRPPVVDVHADRAARRITTSTAIRAWWADWATVGLVEVSETRLFDSGGLAEGSIREIADAATRSLAARV